MNSEPIMPGIRKTPNMSGSSRNAVGRSAQVKAGFLVTKPQIPMMAAITVANTYTRTNLFRSRSVHPVVTRQEVIPIKTTEVKATNWKATSGLSSNETDDT